MINKLTNKMPNKTTNKVTIKRIFIGLALAALLCLQGATLRAEKKPVTDDVVVDTVKRKLATDAVVKGGPPDVDAKDCVALLRGRVAVAKEKDRAEDIAGKADGVKGVDNQIEVVPR